MASRGGFRGRGRGGGFRGGKQFVCSEADATVVNVDVSKEMKFDEYSLSQVTQGKKIPSKRRYIYESLSEFPIQEQSLSDYRKFVIDILVNRGKVNLKHAEKYTENMNTFLLAISHDSVDPTNLGNNYELLEHLGDST